MPIVLLVFIVISCIHYFNGGTPDDLLKVGSIVFLLWMLDVLVNLHIIARHFILKK